VLFWHRRKAWGQSSARPGLSWSTWGDWGKDDITVQSQVSWEQSKAALHLQALTLVDWRKIGVSTEAVSYAQDLFLTLKAAVEAASGNSSRPRDTRKTKQMSLHDYHDNKWYNFTVLTWSCSICLKSQIPSKVHFFSPPEFVTLEGFYCTWYRNKSGNSFREVCQRDTSRSRLCLAGQSSRFIFESNLT